MENLRGAAVMTLAMLGFAIEDMFIKKMAGALPTWQIVLALAIGGLAAFGTAGRIRGERLFPRAILTAPVLLRNLGELIGTMSFITALALIPISTASAILQATPLVVTLGAALFLGESVGWRRWAAIAVGFSGVLLIIRPGTDAFDPRALFAVSGMLGLALRDLSTRRVPKEISSVQLSFLAFLTLVPASALLGLIGQEPPVMPTPAQWGLIAGAVALGVVSYNLIVIAMRLGEVSFVTPFRYSRILFALVIGYLAFAERPDAPMLVGAALIVGSGVFTLWRERRRGRPAQQVAGGEGITGPRPRTGR